MVIAGNGPSDPSQRQTSERRQRKSVSKLMQDTSSTHGYYKSAILPMDISHTIHKARESSDMYSPLFNMSTEISSPSQDSCGSN